MQMIRTEVGRQRQEHNRVVSERKKKLKKSKEGIMQGVTLFVKKAPTISTSRTSANSNSNSSGAIWSSEEQRNRTKVYEEQPGSVDYLSPSKIDPKENIFQRGPAEKRKG